MLPEQEDNMHPSGSFWLETTLRLFKRGSGWCYTMGAVLGMGSSRERPTTAGDGEPGPILQQSTGKSCHLSPLSPTKELSCSQTSWQKSRHHQMCPAPSATSKPRIVQQKLKFAERQRQRHTAGDAFGDLADAFA